MTRKDWYYMNIPSEQADALDKIIEKIGRKIGVADKQQLVRNLIGDYIKEYEKTYGPIDNENSATA